MTGTLIRYAHHADTLRLRICRLHQTVAAASKSSRNATKYPPKFDYGQWKKLVTAWAAPPTALTAFPTV